MTTTSRVDLTNAEQVAAWDGTEGSYWAAHPDQFDRTVERYQRHFHAAAEIRVSDRVLDIGCGNGLTTREAARSATGGEAIGVDLSAQMLAYARSAAAQEGLQNAHFLQADAQIHPFEPSYFDAVISRTGAMFFGRPAMAFANLARALRPSGSLTLLTWQPLESNEWINALTTTLMGQLPPTPPVGAPGPFSLSDPEYVRALLAKAGFDDIVLEGHQEPMVFGQNADEAHAFALGLLGWMLDDRTGSDREQAVESLRQLMVDHESEVGVGLHSAAWIITARRT